MRFLRTTTAALLLLLASSLLPGAESETPKSDGEKGSNFHTLTDADLQKTPVAPDFRAGWLDGDAALTAGASTTPAQYPDADEVVLDRGYWIRYAPTGEYVQWHEEYTKILTERGRKANTVIRSWYTKPYQGDDDCKVLLVELIKPDGSKQVIDLVANGKVQINPGSMSSNIYNPNDKVIVINVPGIEVGDILHVVLYDRTTHPRIPNAFFDWYGFQSTTPMIRSAVELHAPKALPLKNVAVLNPKGETLEATKEEVGDETVYRWIGRELPRIFPEPDMPPAYTLTQRVLVSTKPDWKSLSTWYWNLSLPHYEMTDGIRAKVAELVDEKKTDLEKITAIFTFVSQEIRYLGVTGEAEAPGYEPHDVHLTFDRRHGVCRDKAGLLVVMLREAGFDAYPVLIHNGPRQDKDVPQPFFNHAITGIRKADGTYMLMDSTDESTAQLLPSYLNHKSFLPATPEGEDLMTSPVVPAEENLVKIETKGQIDAEGTLTAESVIHFEGINDNLYRGAFVRWPAERRKLYFEGAIQSAAPGATITRLEIEPKNLQDTSTQITVRLSFEAPGMLIQGNGQALLPMPFLGTRVGLVNWTLDKLSLPERSYPILTGNTAGVHETVSVTLDPSLGKIISIPTSTPIDSDLARWSYKIGPVGDQLRGEIDFRLKKVEYEPSQYAALREVMRLSERDMHKKTILATPGRDEGFSVAKGDVLILQDHRDVMMEDAHTWTETQTVKKKVLTYGGKKRHAELRIRYNPAWESVTVAYARSTAPDGTVQESGEAEKNLMDDNWVGSALRYPGSKTLVVSIPGVEIGSLIEYQIVHEKKDRPAFALREVFAGHDGIRTKTVRVHAPTRTPVQTTLTEMGTKVESTTSRMILTTTEGETIKEMATQTFSASDIAPLPREDSLPPLRLLASTLALSSTDWPTYAKTVHSHLVRASRTQTNAAEKARDLTADAGNALEKIRRIRDFVATEIRHAGPDLNQLPLSAISPADTVLADRYGNTSDRAVLLYAMLESLRLRPHFILASWTPHEAGLYEDLLKAPSPGLFPSVLVEVTVDEKVYTLGDTNQYAPLGATPHEGMLALTLPGGEVKTIETLKPEKTRATYDLDVSETGHAKLTVTRFYYGIAVAGIRKRYAEMTPEERKRHHYSLIGDISRSARAEGELTVDTTSYPATESFSVTIEEYGIRDGNRLYFNLPIGLTNLFRVRSATREMPYYLPSSRNFQREITVSLPSHFSPILTPQTVLWAPDSDDPWVKQESRIIQDDARYTTTVTQTIKQPVAWLSPKEYQSLRELQRRLDHGASQIIMAEKPEEGGAAEAEKKSEEEAKITE